MKPIALVGVLLLRELVKHLPQRLVDIAAVTVKFTAQLAQRALKRFIALGFAAVQARRQVADRLLGGTILSLLCHFVDALLLALKALPALPNDER
jgi:hypothetical protein